MSVSDSKHFSGGENEKIQLFREFPVLEKKLPHVALATLPTPVEKLTAVGNRINLPDLYIKRDDLSGKTYGGNKVRKLEFLLGEAFRKKSREVFTFGFAGSNHALATAIYAQRLRLQCTSLLLPQVNAHYVRRNLLAGFHYNARLCSCKNFAHLFWVLLCKSLAGRIKHGKTSMRIPTGGSCPVGILGNVNGAFESLLGIIKHGKAPMLIPAGGSCPHGVIGYVNGAFELREQISAGRLPEPDRIYVPMGSMGTSTGLILGLKAAGLKSRVIPIRVIEKKIAGPKKMMRLARNTLSLLWKLDPSFPRVQLSKEDFVVRDDCLGPGYAQFTDQSVKAANLMKKETGITLNGTYSAKAFSALLKDARKQILSGKVVLFWNTYNSRDLSSVVKNLDYRELPQSFHHYFEEEVQPLDLAGYDR